MKKLVVVLGVMILFAVILLSNCRPPELEGVVINMNQGLYDKAYDLAKEAVQKYPNNPEAWYLLGDLHARHDKFTEMSEAFDKSLAIGPNFKNQIEQERTKYFADNYNEALRNFYNPAKSEADSVKKRELYRKASEKFLYAHLSMPTRLEPLAPMSVSFLECGDTATAEKYILKAIDINPKNDTLIVSVGDFYYRINQVDKAKQMYEKALTVNPNNSDAYLALGEIYTKREQWDLATDNFKKGMELQPNNPAIPNNIGIILYNNEKFEDAIPYMKKTIELEPDNQNAHEVLSLSYMQAAQKYYEKFSETEKPEFQQMAMKFYEEALPLLQEAVIRFPNSSLLHNNLGICYAQKGMVEEAKEEFEKQKQLEGNP
jgi:tetratricopeptide (TPR) repeat protein